MSVYKKVLVAIDLEGGSEQLLAKVAPLIKQQNSDFFILNVGYFPVPAYVGMYGEGIYSGANIQFDYDAVIQQIIPQIDQAAAAHGLPAGHGLVEFGRPADLILDVAERETADLIVVGSHGKHGIGLLLGSTSNSVLHKAKCDVLSVRINE